MSLLGATVFPLSPNAPAVNVSVPLGVPVYENVKYARSPPFIVGTGTPGAGASACGAPTAMFAVLVVSVGVTLATVGFSGGTTTPKRTMWFVVSTDRSSTARLG